jgi:protein-tyrosine phosphatase
VSLARSRAAVIDLHCHILPGLDDGARSVADSIGMARQAAADGIEAICATPHIRDDHNVCIDDIAGDVAALQEQISAEEVPVRVLPGAEVAQVRAEHLSNAELRTATLGRGGRWLLLEPAPGPIGEHLHALATRLAERGLGTIIAHPERHAGADFEQWLEALAQAGCLIQWTAEFIAQAMPGDHVLSLAERGLVHLLGSDAHSSLAGRPVRLAGGFAALSSSCSPERIFWMAEQAPYAIIHGLDVSPAPA